MHRHLTNLFMLLLSVACVTSPKPPVDEAQAIAFAQAIEAAIRARDWGRLQRSFLPGASVVYQSRGDLHPAKAPPSAWIETLAVSYDMLGYASRQKAEAGGTNEWTTGSGGTDRSRAEVKSLDVPRLQGCAQRRVPAEHS